MNILSKGNIFTQIKQYFSKTNPSPDSNSLQEEKEKAKVEQQDSGIKFGKEG